MEKVFGRAVGSVVARDEVGTGEGGLLDLEGWGDPNFYG